MTDALVSLTVTLHPRTVRGSAGYEYETLDASERVVAEGWCAGTTTEAEDVAKKHAYRNIARRARKGARK